MRATSIRLDETTLARLDALAQETGKSRSEVVSEAIREHLDYSEWFLAQVDEGLKALDEGRIAPREQVAATFRSFGVAID